MARRLPIALALSVALLLSACGGEPSSDGPAEPSGSPTASTSEASSSESPSAGATASGSASSAASALPDFRTTRGSGKGASGVVVTDIRVGRNDGFERVVIDVDGEPPAWRAQYQRRFVQDGSGEAVPLRGRSGLLLVLQASGHDENYEPVYDGPKVKRTPDLAALKGFTVTGDFEGQFSLGFALNERAPYRVFALRSPSRLVVDFQTG